MGTPNGPRPREVVCGITDPKQAWEALIAAGFLPQSMVEDPRRKFRWVLDRKNEKTELSPYPLRISQAVAIANDVQSFLTAEALARETASALVSINQWWMKRGFQHKYDHLEKIHHPTDSVDHIVWEEKYEGYHTRQLFAGDGSWSHPAHMGVLASLLPERPYPDPERESYCRYSEAMTESRAWDSGDHFLVPHDESDYMCRETSGCFRYCRVLRKESLNPLIHSFPNPYRPLLSLALEHHHGQYGIMDHPEHKNLSCISIGYACV